MGISRKNNIIDMGESNLQTFFSSSRYINVFISSFTMRCFAEEKKTGTLEILITQPISIFQIIISKFLAASFLAVLTIYQL